MDATHIAMSKFSNSSEQRLHTVRKGKEEMMARAVKINARVDTAREETSEFANRKKILQSNGMF